MDEKKNQIFYTYFRLLTFGLSKENFIELDDHII